MKDYAQVVELLRHAKLWKLTPHLINRPGYYHTQLLYQGLSALILARQTGESHWRETGEEAVRLARGFEKLSKWNFEHRARLLEAELHYLDGNVALAGPAYIAAIESACAHKHLNHEALALELYGTYLVENGGAVDGVEKLKLAMEKYESWGAMPKVDQMRRSLAL